MGVTEIIHDKYSSVSQEQTSKCRSVTSLCSEAMNGKKIKPASFLAGFRCFKRITFSIIADCLCRITFVVMDGNFLDFFAFGYFFEQAYR